MIWVLDNSEDTISELMDRIRKFAIPITSASNIRLDYSFRPEDKEVGITKTAKRNLLLIAKEAINNSIKYSRCHAIKIDCKAEKSGLCLHIEDDGIGFDPGRPSFGNGLRNMVARAAQINYHCRIESAPGTGTRIIISKKQTRRS